MSSKNEIRLAMDTARRAVQVAGEAALRVSRGTLDIETKPDGTPVGRADREAEAAILRVIAEAFPRHAVLAEESGRHDGDAGHLWIVDPLDGTRGFARGGSFWGPLVAYRREGVVIAGAMALPALGRNYWAARGLGAYRDGTALHVSSIARWSEAIVSLGEMRALTEPPHGALVLELARTAASVRIYGDLAGAATLLDGVADAWIEAGVRAWDLGPIPVLVEEAGGRFSDFEGAATIESGRAVAANAALHEHAVSILRGSSQA